jgi:hypothetical protein
MWLDLEKMALKLVANLAATNRRAEAEKVCEVCAEVTGELMIQFGEPVMEDAELRELILPHVRRAIVRWETPSTI